MESDYVNVLKSRAAALVKVFGPIAGVLGSPIPIYLGGDVDIAYFKGASPGTIVLCSHGMSGWESGQIEGERGQYELVMVIKEGGPLAPARVNGPVMSRGWAATLVNGVAKYSTEALLKPGETTGPLPAAFGGLESILFWELTSDRRPFVLSGVSHGLLLCIGITIEEREHASTHGASSLVSLLRKHSVFPMTDPDRKSVV